MSVTTFIGYHERAPFLWSVDMHRLRIEPAAELKRIPQGIDDVVPLDEAVAYRCGHSALLTRSLNVRARAR